MISAINQSRKKRNQADGIITKKDNVWNAMEKNVFFDGVGRNLLSLYNS